MPQRLVRLLEKNPIIPTATASHLTKHPGRVEALYMETAKTHMSIGQTGQYQKRILECILRNANTFNGAVVGEYGYGKTSMLIFLWAHCLENKIMAVPPYQWDRIDEHITIINSWVLYKLRGYDQRVLDDIVQICDKYKKPSIEAEAKKWSAEHKLDMDVALRIIKNMFDSGKLSLDIKADNIIDYCEELTTYLSDNTEYKGLLVITDELQQTITHLNQKTVYDFLFDMTNQLVERKGNYGFLWGFPIQTQADLQRSRSDILDRLNSNKFFLKLFNIYDTSFPVVLWDKYCEYLDIENLKHTIVDGDVLVSIGQICDGERRDLGNGPRSVISSFNRIAGYFIQKSSTYNIINLVDDCLDNQIVLGDRSEFNKRLDSILSTPDFTDDEKNTLKILAAFPNGIPDYVIKEHCLSDKIDNIIQKTGGLGRVIVKDLNSYALKVMRKSNVGPEDTVVEDEVRKYYSQFSPDKEHEVKSLKVFNEILEGNIFCGGNGNKFETWKLRDKGIDYNYQNHIFYFDGSFTEKFPLRRVRIVTRIKGRAPLEKNPAFDDTKEDMSFTFELCKDTHRNKRIVKVGNDNSFILQLSLSQQKEAINEQKISDIVPSDKQTPIFFMGLIDHLNNSAIPNDELKIKEHLIAMLKENIIYNLFNDDLLGEVEGTSIELNNQGEYLIKDLYRSVCDNIYGDYVTLMTGPNWKSKITSYINALKIKNEFLGLMELRGNAPVHLSEDKTENKSRIAKIFNVGAANFDSYLSDMKSLAKFKNNDFYFQIHPLEESIKKLLETYGTRVVIDGNECLSADFGPTVVRVFKKSGYTDDEINYVLEIMEARQLLKYNRATSIVFKILEDKSQLTSSIKEYFDKVCNFYINLRNVESKTPDFTTEIAKIRAKIECIETSEHASTLRAEIRGILVQFINLSANGLKSLQMSLKSTKELLHDESGALKNLVDNDLKEFPVSTLLWQDEITKRRHELTNEITSLASQAKNLSAKANSITPTAISEDESVILDYIETQQKALVLNIDIDSFRVCANSAKEKARYLGKWKLLIRLCDSLNEKILLHSRSFENDNYKDAFRSYNEKVANGLQNNPYITLQNYENYKTEITLLQTKVHDFINNMRFEWEAKVDFCKKQIKKIAGNEPNWTLRWSDIPSQAYIDLEEAVQAELKRLVKRIDSQLSQMDDDVLYTKEVLNHAGAIKNKSIQERITIVKQTVAETALLLDGADLCKNDNLEHMADQLAKTNIEFADLNRLHLAIIKPTPIESDSEKSFYDLLDKNEGLDLKSLIIEYQKVRDSHLDLTESRDAVLDIIKTLFLKKQITLQVRRGKV